MKNILFSIFVLVVTSCSCQDKIVKENQLSASYQTWIAGVRGGGSGINFYLEFKSELPSNIELKKVIFRGYEVPFEKQDNLHFQAMIKTPGNQQKYEEDNAPNVTSPKNDTKLQDNEAILVFSKKGKRISAKNYECN